jgi:hypothetical protein
MKTNLITQVLRRMTSAGVSAGLALCAVQAQDNKPVEPRPTPPRPQPEAQAPKPNRPAPARTVPFLGLVLASVDESMAAQLNLPEGTGVLVRAVMPESPAAKAGVLQHDVLRYFNDQLLTNEPQLQTLVRQAGVGTEVTLKLLRKGKEESVVVKLGEHALRENEQREGPQPPRWPGRNPADQRPPKPSDFGFGVPRYMPLNSDGFAEQVRELSERMRKLEGKPEQMREEVERFTREIEQANRARGAAERQEAWTKKNAAAARPGGSAGSSVRSGDGGIRVEVFSNDSKADNGGQNSVTATTDDKGNIIVPHGVE